MQSLIWDQSVLAGDSIANLTRTLRAEPPIPFKHWKRIGAPVRMANYADSYAWIATTIGYILEHPEYMGRKILGNYCKEIREKNGTYCGACMLRYTFTSNLLSYDADLKNVRDMSGHSDVNTTMNIHAHASREAKRSSAKLLDKAASNGQLVFP